MSLRVLITGFNDWHSINGNVWKCCENPSCRLLLGCACDSPPEYGKREGELPKELEKNMKDVKFSYTTLPTIWGTGAVIAGDNYDIIIHLGLGKYDENEIVLEDGAFNYRKGEDAIGYNCDAPISENSSHIKIKSQSEIVQHLHNSSLPNNYKITTLPARMDNTYICNETYYRTLGAVEDGRLQAGYFIHIPTKRDSDDGFDKLAGAISDVIQKLIRLSIKSS